MRRYWAADDELALLLQAYFDADLVVSTAGGFLYSSGAVGLVYGVAVFTMLLAGAMGKPLYMLPQSLGPFHRSWERWLLRRLAARIRLMMVREQHSLDLLERIGVQPARCHLVPDMAFCLNVAPRPRATEWLTTLGVQLDRRQPKIGFTVINWGAENRRFAGQANYEAAVAALARHCVHRYQTQILLFVQVTGPSLSQNDAIVTCRLAHQLSDIAAHLAVVAPVPQPELLAASYGLMDVFVGTRMHSNIFAMVAGVPLLAIGYQPKTQGIMQMVGLHKWVVGIEQVRPAQLCAMFDQLWAERVEVRQQLARRLPELRGEVHRAMHRVVMDFRACRP
jgi:colanic acid/amylovoran biosynthesis protein